MPRGIFTLKQQLQSVQQKAWNDPVATYAGSFNGTSQYLTSSTNANLALGTSSFTVEYWLYMYKNANNPIVTFGGTGANYDAFFGYAANEGVNAQKIQWYLTSAATSWDITGGYTAIVMSGLIPINMWHHVAFVRNGNTFSMYVDGQLINSGTSSASIYQTANSVMLGNGQLTGYFPGLISNFRFVKGTALYTTNFTPPKGPLTAITGTQLLTLQNPTFVDNSSNGITFTNTGSVQSQLVWPFTQLQTPAVDYLVVAGGGGTGSYVGGGGAGGLLQGNVPIITGTSYTVTVGAGGAATTSNNVGNQGVSSVFGSISTIGGGAGATPGGNGGSGGGSGQLSNATPYFGGQGTTGQGNPGGSCAGGATTATYFGGGGGGGAGSVGLNGTLLKGGNGGIGIASVINGTITTYAGGGGGAGYDAGGPVVAGTGGTGGGGNGGYGATGSAGTANTGGGGGGGAPGATGFAGGSGIVIISYPDIYAGATATTGSPVVSTTGSGSLYFAGSSNYLTYASNAAFGYGTGNFTEEVWIYPTASNWTTGNFYISDHGGNLLQLQYYLNALNWNSGAIVGSTTIPANTWSHIAVVRNSTTVVLYLNGTSIGSVSSSTNFSTTLLTIGTYGGGGAGNSYQGYISNFRAVKGTAVYTGNFTPSTAPLTAITNTSLLLNSVSGTYLADGSTNAFSPTVTGSVPWNQASPFATGLGYKNRVYTYTASGTITF